MMKGIYSPPTDQFYYQFPISEEVKPFMKHVIGKDGRHFIRLTKYSKTKYLWYDDIRGVIEIWGPHEKLQKAEKLIKKHIVKVMKSLEDNKDGETTRKEE